MSWDIAIGRTLLLDKTQSMPTALVQCKYKCITSPYTAVCALEDETTVYTPVPYCSHGIGLLETPVQCLGPYGVALTSVEPVQVKSVLTPRRC